MSWWVNLLILVGAFSAVTVTLFEIKHRQAVTQFLALLFVFLSVVLATPDLTQYRMAMSLLGTLMIGWNLECRKPSHLAMKVIYAILVVLAALIPIWPLMKYFIPWVIIASLITALISVITFSRHKRLESMDKS